MFYKVNRLKISIDRHQSLQKSPAAIQLHNRPVSRPFNRPVDHLHRLDSLPLARRLSTVLVMAPKFILTAYGRSLHQSPTSATQLICTQLQTVNLILLLSYIFCCYFFSCFFIKLYAIISFQESFRWTGH